jgi:hypothetical protein
LTEDRKPNENAGKKALLSSTVITDTTLDFRIVDLVRLLARKAAEQDFRQELRRHWHTQKTNFNERPPR